MPSRLPLPTIDDHLAVADDALRGELDRYGDTRRGTLYEHASGPMAILFARQAERDRDSFRAIYFDDADGPDLTRRGAILMQVPRILDTYGQGFATLRRPTAAGGGGPIWRGTRIQVSGAPPSVYQVSQDTQANANDLQTVVPIRALQIGSGTAMNAVGGLALLDSIYDPAWSPTSLQCADGTDFEPADVYRDRARAERVNARNGYVPKLVQACGAVGAAYVLAFASSYGLPVTVNFNDPNIDESWDNDAGLNAIYVADANYQSPASLVDDCAVALEAVRVLGADLWVGGMVQTAVQVAVSVHLVDDPGRLPAIPVRRAATQALLGYFGPSSQGYIYKQVSLAAAIAASHPAIQGADVTVSIGGVVQTVDPTLTSAAWPAVLPRYTLAPRDIALTLTGPA